MTYRPGPQQLCGQTAQRRSNSSMPRVSAGILRLRKDFSRRFVSFRHIRRKIDSPQCFAIAGRAVDSTCSDGIALSSPESPHHGAEWQSCQSSTQPARESRSAKQGIPRVISPSLPHRPQGADARSRSCGLKYPTPFPEVAGCRPLQAGKRVFVKLAGRPVKQALCRIEVIQSVYVYAFHHCLALQAARFQQVQI